MDRTPLHKPKMLSLPQSGKFREERHQLFESLSMLLASGTDLLTAVSVIEEEMESTRMRRALERLRSDISGGSKLSQALNGVGLVSEREMALLAIGEESGHLTDHMDLIAKQEERDRQFAGRIQSATLYPIIVLSIALLLGIGIAWFILPKLADVFRSLRLELPLATRMIVWGGEFLQKYGFVAVPLFLASFGTALYVVFFMKKTRHIGQWILMHLPGVKKLILEAEASRFGYLFGTLLDAGIPIVSAIEALEDATTMKAYKRLYRHLAEEISLGRSVGESFRSYPGSGRLIPLSAQHTISAAAESGRLSSTLLSIGERYGAKLELTTKNLGTFLEPIMIVLIWLIVVFMAFAVISPIYGLLQGIR